MEADTSQATMADEAVQQTELRENLIETSIKFLQNPKVRQSPFPQRRTFLQNKGLTKEEIDAAIARSGTAGDEHSLPQPAAQQGAGQVQPYMAQPVVAPPPPESPWSKARDYLATIIVVGGIGYTVYQLYKKYIYPVWFGPTQEQQQLADIRASVKELEGNIAETLKAIQEMQGTLKQQQDSLETVVSTDMASRGNTEYKKMMDHQQVTEIKDEIKSLKGLLLTRNQFPPTPKTAPVLPSWQLEASNKQTPNKDAKPATSTGSGAMATEKQEVAPTQVTESVANQDSKAEEASSLQMNGTVLENGDLSASTELGALTDTQATSSESEITKEQAVTNTDTTEQLTTQ